MIYAIAVEGLPYIKFGKAKNPKTRLKELQIGSPHRLRLVAAVDWHDSNEFLIHMAFKNSRYRSEWFIVDDNVAGLLNIMMCPNAHDEQLRFGVAMEYISEKITLEDRMYFLSNYGISPD